MKLTKRLSKLGDAASGHVLTENVLAQLGLNVAADATAADAHVTLTFYGNTLIVRRADAQRPTPAEVAYFLTDDLGVAQHFPTTSPTSTTDETYVDLEALFKPGVNLRSTPMMRHGLGLFKLFGELSRDDLIERFKIAPAQATRILRTGFENQALLKRGNRYWLSPEVFDV